MIVDCHSHIWTSRSQLGRADVFSCLAGQGSTLPTPEAHQEASRPAEVVLVLGFVSSHCQAEISNQMISSYVSSRRSQALGFAGIDPVQKGSLKKLRQLHSEDGFVGITLSPACQCFHPCDTRVMKLYEQALELSMPVYFLHGESLPSSGVMEYTRPEGLDEVARTFPDLKIVLSHLGYPWTEQTISLLAKHENVFADVAGLTNKPWQAYRSLTLAYEYGVIEKLLFASDFPSHTVKTAVESLYNLNKVTLDSVLPAVPREQLRGIVERDSLSLLGLTEKITFSDDIGNNA